MESSHHLLWRELASVALFCLAGCASQKMATNGAVEVASADALPPPMTENLVAGQRVHYVGPFDRISIDVLGLPELSRDVRVDAHGDIEVPIGGTVNVIGKTPEDVAQAVQSRLRASYVRDPHVTVAIVETVSQTVTVDGEVRVPGIYPVLGQMTLMRAVASAQGISDNALASHVVVFRTVGNKQMAALYDLRAIRLGAYKDPQIYTNDVVVVGESAARRLFPQILQAASLALTPVVAILNTTNNN